MAKRGRSARLESSIHRILTFEEEHGRLPNCSSEEINDRIVWKTLSKDYADDQDVAMLIERHPEDSGEGRRIANRQKRMKKHLDRLFSKRASHCCLTSLTKQGDYQLTIKNLYQENVGHSLRGKL